MCFEPLGLTAYFVLADIVQRRAATRQRTFDSLLVVENSHGAGVPYGVCARRRSAHPVPPRAGR